MNYYYYYYYYYFHFFPSLGHDMQSLLYDFLDELLYVFSSKYVICFNVEVTELDKKQFRIKAKCEGEEFDLKKHPQGTEVKAITYSAMQIIDKENEGEGAHIYVII